MAKKNKETEAPLEAQTLRTAEPPASPAPAQATAAVEVESGASIPNTPRSDQLSKAQEEYIQELRAEVGGLKEDYAEACANLARIHAFAVGEVTGPSRGVVEDVEDVINALRARVDELEGRAAIESQDVGATAPAATEPDHKALAAQAYDLFRKSQAEGEFPAWAELPEQTQKLWRDSYQHVAAGGKPRTDYEEAVKYLINFAQ